MRRKLLLAAVATFVVVVVALIGGLWFATNQLLYPSWKGATKDVEVASPGSTNPIALVPPEVSHRWVE